MYVGRAQMTLNNGQKRKYLYFQSDFRLKTMIKKNKNNKGLTLIEILISIIITSVMVAAMYTSYNVVSGAYKQVSDKAKISGSSRDLVTMIMRDIRMAGFRYYAGEHAAQEFLNNPLNATCVADGPSANRKKLYFI